MNDGRAEPRTPVMIVVEAFWKEEDGTRQRLRARIENKSVGGACIRLGKKVSVGTRLWIEGHREKFSGEARYCRKDGREYLVGLQRDKPNSAVAARHAESFEMELPVLTAIVPTEEASGRIKLNLQETVSEKVVTESASGVINVKWTETKTIGNENRCEPKFEGLGQVKQIRMPFAKQEGGKEGKHMRHKWFEMGHKDEEPSANSVGNHRAVEVVHASTPVASAEPASGPVKLDQQARSNVQVELLPMEDIYRMAGILSPRKGYSINKISEMLRSEHLRGLSKEMKRASILMALDAAGISAEEVLQDAKARHEAIDSYEAEQRRQFEAQLARKAEENSQIQAEMERVKARYTERLRRNLDGMTREKATFANWLTLKQQESQNITEAVDLCLKPPTSESPKTVMDEVSLAGAHVKPV